jgi:NCS1 family nucleobase:cation symporter-1
MSTTAPPPVTANADGRIELAESVVLDDARFANPDLIPVPVAKRRWSTYNFLALWVGMSHNIATWTLASGLVALGMDWKQSVLTIAIANVIVLVPVILNGHAGTRYGIPFPVFARAAFGLRGANLPAVIRALVACVWFGIQTWIGGGAIFALGGKAFGHWWADASVVGGQPWTEWLSFAAFWIIQVVVIVRGMDTLRRFENWAAPLVLVGAIGLLAWVGIKAGGLGPLLSQPSKLGWGSGFWKVFFPSLMGMIGFWSTLSLNIPDFTRFGGSQRAQARGQALGLPTTMTIFSLLAVLVTSGSQALFGTPIWDPVELLTKLNNVAGTLIGLFVVLIATLSVNIAANVVSPAYDFANLLPKLVTFRTGALITGVIGVVILPWKLYSNPNVYIFTWLGTVGGLLGTVAGILIADYWVLRRTSLALDELYKPSGRYWYAGGWNWRAVLAFAVGGLLAIGGSYSSMANGVKQGPFPAKGLIPFLQPLADYGWAVGLGAAFVLYIALTRLVPPTRESNAEPSLA